MLFDVNFFSAWVIKIIAFISHVVCMLSRLEKVWKQYYINSLSF